MTSLIDANVIVRFLVGDHKEHFIKAKEIFISIEEGNLQVIILDVVFLEVFFVLTKFYKISKNEILSDLKTILALKGVINSDKVILNEAFNLMENKHIDFVYALICAKSNLQGYKKISFDKKVR